MRPKIPFLGKKNKQIYQFKLKFDTWTNLNMKNWIVMLFFFCLGHKYPFLENFFPKNQLLKLKFKTYTNLNMENWMVIFFVCLFLFFLFVLDWKQLFWVNLVPKFKSVSWSWNLVPYLYWICKIWWWCSFFCWRLFPFSILMLTD